MATLGVSGRTIAVWGRRGESRRTLLSTEAAQGPKSVDPLFQRFSGFVGFNGLGGWMDSIDAEDSLDSELMLRGY
jgi:hypothetical protein